MRRTLVGIAQKLNRNNDIWLLAGNTAAILQGVIVKASKLTFYTTRIGAYQFGEFFQEFKKERVKYREKPPLSGHAGYFIINDIDVYVVGDPEIFWEHRKFPVPVEDIYLDSETAIIESNKVPLLPLPWLLILALLADDLNLANAISACTPDKLKTRAIADNLGVGFYLKPKLSSYFGE